MHILLLGEIFYKLLLKGSIMNTVNLDIYTRNKDAMVKMIGKMNRKCIKLGLPEIVSVWSDEYIAKEIIDDKPYYYEKQFVSVSFPNIKVSEEWELIGKIGVLTDNLNFVFSLSQTDELKEYSNKPCQCEHCKKNMSRNKVYVIRNTFDSRKMVVGSTCMKDFLGQDITSKLQLAEMRERFIGFGHLRDSDKPLDGMTLALFLDVTLGCILADKGRFYSKKNMEQNNMYATIFNVEEWYLCFLKGAIPDSYPFFFDKNEVEIFANNILDELRVLSESEDMGQFERNVVNCFNLGFVPSKMFSSVVGYVGNWWVRNNVVKNDSNFNPKLSEYIGKEKDKIEATVVVDKVVESSSDYGGVIIFGHVVGTNNKFGWYTTTANELYLYDGSILKASVGEFKIRATIKSLKPDEKFGNTTWITRAKII